MNTTSNIEEAIKIAEKAGYTIIQKTINTITLVEWNDGIRFRILGHLFNLKEVAKVDKLADAAEKVLANYRAAVMSKQEKLEYADKIFTMAMNDGNESMISLAMKIIDDANTSLANSRMIAVDTNVVFATLKYYKGDEIIDVDGDFTDKYYESNGTCVHIVG